jgi:hypothetical protein
MHKKSHRRGPQKFTKETREETVLEAYSGGMFEKEVRETFKKAGLDEARGRSTRKELEDRGILVRTIFGWSMPATELIISPPPEVVVAHTENMRGFFEQFAGLVESIDGCHYLEQEFPAKGGIIPLSPSLLALEGRPFYCCLDEHPGGMEIKEDWMKLKNAIKRTNATFNELRSGIVSLVESKLDLQWLEWPESKKSHITTDYMNRFYRLIMSIAKQNDRESRERVSRDFSSMKTTLDRRYTGYLCYGTKNEAWVCIESAKKLSEDELSDLRDIQESHRLKIIEDIGNGALVDHAEDLLNNKKKVIKVRDSLVKKIKELQAFPTTPGICHMERESALKRL